MGNANVGKYARFYAYAYWRALFLCFHLFYEYILFACAYRIAKYISERKKEK
jgi:hypothetical protein